MERYISLPKDNSKVFRIDSGIVARGVGAGSGGFSRSVLSYILLLKTTCRISNNHLLIFRFSYCLRCIDFQKCCSV